MDAQRERGVWKATFPGSLAKVSLAPGTLCPFPAHTPGEFTHAMEITIHVSDSRAVLCHVVVGTTEEVAAKSLYKGLI